MERAKLSQRLDWETDGRDWPNRAHSHFVKAAGLTWHVQEFGSIGPNKPKILLLHGTGSSSHSWRDVAPLLALRYQVVAIDLPGHAFTSMPPAVEQSLSGMSRNVAELLRVMSFTPTLVIGHSAGAAVAYDDNLKTTIPPFTAVAVVEAPTGGISLNGQTGPLVVGTFTPSNFVGAPTLSLSQPPVVQTGDGTTPRQLIAFRNN
jgi:magnesium chelatase accessory protein